MSPRVDRPTYQETHRAWIQILAQLEAERCIAQDGDTYGLIPLGLLQLEDEEAVNVLRVGDELRVLLRERYLSPATRKRPALVSELARRLTSSTRSAARNAPTVRRPIDTGKKCRFGIETSVKPSKIIQHHYAQTDQNPSLIFTSVHSADWYAIAKTE